jgi:hypothetical protein
MGPVPLFKRDRNPFPVEPLIFNLYTARSSTIYIFLLLDISYTTVGALILPQAMLAEHPSAGGCKTSRRVTSGFMVCVIRFLIFVEHTVPICTNLSTNFRYAACLLFTLFFDVGDGSITFIKESIKLLPEKTTSNPPRTTRHSHRFKNVTSQIVGKLPLPILTNLELR